MRTPSMVLGIIGGVIAILFGLFMVLGGVVFLDDSWWDETYDTGVVYDGIAYQSYETAESDTIAAAVFITLGACSVASGVLGLAGGCIVKKKNRTAGVMMIIAAVLSAIGFFNLISVVLFILGAVFALKKEPQPMPYPPYPYYGYPQYPQYPYPQYPQYPYPQYQYPPQPPVPPQQQPPEPPQPSDGTEPPKQQ